MYELILSPRAYKELEKLERSIKQKVDRAFLKLQQTPFKNFKIIKDKRLANFRLRVGDYRVLYDVYEKEKFVYILRIGHRKDIYR